MLTVQTSAYLVIRLQQVKGAIPAVVVVGAAIYSESAKTLSRRPTTDAFYADVLQLSDTSFSLARERIINFVFSDSGAQVGFAALRAYLSDSEEMRAALYRVNHPGYETIMRG